MAGRCPYLHSGKVEKDLQHTTCFCMIEKGQSMQSYSNELRLTPIKILQQLHALDLHFKICHFISLFPYIGY